MRGKLEYDFSQQKVMVEKVLAYEFEWMLGRHHILNIFFSFILPPRSDIRSSAILILSTQEQWEELLQQA